MVMVVMPVVMMVMVIVPIVMMVMVSVPGGTMVMMMVEKENWRWLDGWLVQFLHIVTLNIAAPPVFQDCNCLSFTLIG